MKKHLIISTIALAAGISGALAQAPKEERFAIKAYGTYPLTKALVTASNANCITGSDTQSYDLGVDFGYMFYKQDNWRLWVNVGVSVTPSRQTMTLSPTESSYEAGSEADEDGNSYVRYVETSALSQKVQSTYVGVPVYLDVDLRVHRLISVYGQIGFRAMFKATSTVSDIEGTTSAYGVYPEYDNLVIDDPIMNAFGHMTLRPEMAKPVETKSFVPEMMVGVGLRVNLYKPLWLDLGFSYRYSGDMVTGEKSAYPDGFMTDAVAPVTYTVAEGLRVNPPTHYLRGNHRNTMFATAGLIFKF